MLWFNCIMVGFACETLVFVLVPVFLKSQICFWGKSDRIILSRREQNRLDKYCPLL